MSPFVRGMLSAFDFYPFAPKDTRPGWVKDAEAMRSAWEAVGKNMWEAIWIFEDENNLPRTKIVNCYSDYAPKQEDDGAQMELPLAPK